MLSKMAFFVPFQATVFEDIGGGVRGNRLVEHGYKAGACREADWPMCTDSDWVGIQLDRHYSTPTHFSTLPHSITLDLLLCHDKYSHIWSQLSFRFLNLKRILFHISILPSSVRK